MFLAHPSIGTTSSSALLPPASAATNSPLKSASSASVMPRRRQRAPPNEGRQTSPGVGPSRGCLPAAPGGPARPRGGLGPLRSHAGHRDEHVVERPYVRKAGADVWMSKSSTSTPALAIIPSSLSRPRKWSTQALRWRRAGPAAARLAGAGPCSGPNAATRLMPGAACSASTMCVPGASGSTPAARACDRERERESRRHRETARRGQRASAGACAPPGAAPAGSAQRQSRGRPRRSGLAGAGRERPHRSGWTPPPRLPAPATAHPLAASASKPTRTRAPPAPAAGARAIAGARGPPRRRLGPAPAPDRPAAPRPCAWRRARRAAAAAGGGGAAARVDGCGAGAALLAPRIALCCLSAGLRSRSRESRLVDRSIPSIGRSSAFGPRFRLSALSSRFFALGSGSVARGGTFGLRSARAGAACARARPRGGAAGAARGKGEGEGGGRTRTRGGRGAEERRASRRARGTPRPEGEGRAAPRAGAAIPPPPPRVGAAPRTPCRRLPPRTGGGGGRRRRRGVSGRHAQPAAVEAHALKHSCTCASARMAASRSSPSTKSSPSTRASSSSYAPCR